MYIYDCVLILMTRCNLNSNPGIDPPRFILGASRLVVCLTAIADEKLDTNDFVGIVGHNGLL